MNSRVGPTEQTESRRNSMELENITTGDDPYSVDPYDNSEHEGPEQSLSRHLPSRAVGTRHGTVRQRSGRRKSIPTIDLNEEDEDEDEDEDIDRVKSVAAPMHQKREMRKQQSQKVKHISCWKAFKLRTAMGWHRFSSSIKEFFQDIELWKGHLKQVEGHFGNGVLSYFLFLKWLMFLNLFLFVLVFGYTGVPSLIANKSTEVYHNVSSARKTNSCMFGVPDHRYADKSVDSLIVDFITGQGWINTTIMFYSNYPSETLIFSDLNYNLPLAYLLIGGIYFFVSLLLMVKNLTKSFEESYIEGGGTFYSYCNKVFASWDYCISDENTANVKSQNIIQDINAEIAEEERLDKVYARTTGMKCKLYSLRILISILVIGLLGGAIYAIIYAVEVSTDPSIQEGKSNIVRTVIRSAPSLTITVLNLLLPPFFVLLSQAEDWSPRFEVALNLWRTVLLRLASVAVLMITLYAEVGTRCKEQKDLSKCCQQSWENEIASQMYMLIWIDLFVVIMTTVLMETTLKLLHKHTKLFRKLNVMPEFQISKNVLDLVYGQCLIWIGAFFSPIIPAMGVVKLFITFYLKKVGLMYNNKPSNRPYQGARSNYLFTVLLLITFFMCLVAVGWGITKVRPSCHGPFSNPYCKDKEIIDEISNVMSAWPSAITEIINYISTAAFIFPVLMIFFLLIYYFRSMIRVHLQMIEMLKDQLVLEGRDKRYLMEKLISSGKKETEEEDDDNAGASTVYTRESTLQPSGNMNF